MSGNRESRAALRESEASYRSLFDAAEEAIFVHDLATGEILAVNRRVAEMYGYSVDEARRLDVGTLSAGEPPYTQEEAVRRVRRAAAGERQVFEWLAKDRAGRRFWVEVSLKRATIGGQERLLALVHDISARKQAEREHAERVREQAARAVAEATRAHFQSLLEAAPDAIVVVDGAGRIVLVNSQAEVLFGYPRVELLGQLVELLVPEGIRVTHLARRAAYAGQPDPPSKAASLAMRGRRRDGSEFPAEISLSPLETDEGPLVISIVRDITERTRITEQLQQQAADLARSNADLQQFAYVASHDLQEPLRMVASYTQLLARRYQGKLDADADEFIAFAVDGATRMQHLIEDLLAYSRVGTRGKQFASTDVNVVVSRVLRDLQGTIDGSRAVVTRDDLPTVDADAVQLGEVFQNLIANALKFRGAEDPRVRVSAERDGNTWRFAVRDNGIGIEPRHAERIFVIFQRLHARADYPGTGIGLAICKRIVERHGGKIWVDSRPGAGSTFSFTLPAHPEARRI
jgi:PAS domain S-box-containing protein